MNLRPSLIVVSTCALTMTCSAYAQNDASEVTTHQYGSPLQRNLNAAAPSDPNAADAARRCGELAKTYADSIGPQRQNTAAAGSPNYGQDGRNVESETDLAARNRRDDARKAYRDSGCK
jgi:hypothetical protein